MQEHALGFRGVETTPVPDHIARELGYAGEVRFRAKRDQDSAVETRLLAAAEFPFAVQVQPLNASKLRPRVFGSWLHLTSH
jgi:hypothetical protein